MRSLASFNFQSTQAIEVVVVTTYQQDGGAEVALHAAEPLREEADEARVARRRRHGSPAVERRRRSVARQQWLRDLSATYFCPAGVCHQGTRGLSICRRETRINSASNPTLSLQKPGKLGTHVLAACEWQGLQSMR